MQGRRTQVRQFTMWTGKLLLAVVLVVLLVESIQSRAILSLLSGAQPLMLAAAMLLLPLNIAFQYQKWRVLVHSRFPDAGAVELRASLLLGFTFGIVTPARIGEFGGRAAGMRGTGANGAQLLAADRFALVGLTAVDKFATMLVTLIAGGAGLLLFCWRHPFMDPLLLTFLMLLAAGAAVLWLRRGSATAASSTHAAQPEAVGGFFRRRYNELRQTLRGIDAARRRVLMLHSVLFYLTFLLQFYFLLLAFGPVDLLSALAGISTIMLIKTVIPPITLGELGIREGASVYVLGHAGIIAAAAFNASLLLFAINILLPSLAGLFVLLRLPSRTNTERIPDAGRMSAAGRIADPSEAEA